MHRLQLVLILACLLLDPITALADDRPQRLFRELRCFRAAAAHQGVAVDQRHFYAVSNRAISKFDKRSGRRVANWKAPRDSSLQHLNSGVMVDGRLYCAHSNWPNKPTVNSVEIWDAAKLEHTGRQELKNTDGGALTWIDRRDGHWWAVFAHYGEPEQVERTRLVKLDDKWQPKSSWRFPRGVIERFAPFSNSGGSWGPNGLLHVTGHDRAEVYAMRIPSKGDSLELVEILPAAIEGQGVAWDRSSLGVLYGIRRRSKEVVVLRLSHSREFERLQQCVRWKRDPRNPILPPGKSGSFDAARCMNPWVLRDDDEYHLYYSGGDDHGRQRIGLATAAVDDLANWKRHDPLLETGKAGSFDARWCVLPHVVRIAGDRWHLYYTGNAGHGQGLSAFPGIGLAVSRDGQAWSRSLRNPVLVPSGERGEPDAIGIAGGSLLQVKREDGKAVWRFYYTGCPTVGKPLELNQQKTICLAVSEDGVNWQKRGAVMFRDPQRDYENIGVAGPVVLAEPEGGFRMWYSAIGTRWGYYSICNAESDDGIHWRRGAQAGDNLQLVPEGDGWESQMVEYPAVIREGDRLRLFYCGNGYGRTGIGTAISMPRVE